MTDVAAWRPGTWQKWSFGPTHVVGAAVGCPQCGRGMSIGGGAFGSVHAISVTGQVTPSVVCPYVGCGWHVWARLEGWPGAGGAVRT